MSENSKRKIDYYKEYTALNGQQNNSSGKRRTNNDGKNGNGSNELLVKEMTTELNTPWKIILQNARGIVTENSNEKLGILENYTKTDKIILMNITETWLNDTITEGANIDGYNIHRSDRKGKKNGGTAIYLNNKLEAEEICQISYENCEMIAVSIPDM